MPICEACLMFRCYECCYTMRPKLTSRLERSSLSSRSTMWLILREGMVFHDRSIASICTKVCQECQDGRLVPTLPKRSAYGHAESPGGECCSKTADQGTQEKCLSIILPTDSTGLGLFVFDKGISQSMNGTSRQLAMLQYTNMPS